MIIRIDVTQNRTISYRLVANGNMSEEFVSMLHKHTHVIVWTANADPLSLEIRLKPRPDPVIY